MRHKYSRRVGQHIQLVVALSSYNYSGTIQSIFFPHRMNVHSPYSTGTKRQQSNLHLCCANAMYSSNRRTLSFVLSSSLELKVKSVSRFRSNARQTAETQNSSTCVFARNAKPAKAIAKLCHLSSSLDSYGK